MSDVASTITGSCLCGAVTVTATACDPALRACHCEMCRKHTSSMFMSLATDPGSVAVDGPLKIFASSDWAERGFCGICGSTIYYGTRSDGARNLAAGLFPNVAGAPMRVEFFADNCPASYALAGDHKKLTTEQTLDLFQG